MPDPTLHRLEVANPVEPGPPTPTLETLVAGWTASGAVAPGERPGTGALKPRLRGRIATWAASGLLIAAVGTASAAAAFTALTGSPLPPSADTFAVSPEPGRTRIATVRAVDPDGGPAWTVRLGTAEAGLLCIGVGQVGGDGFGLVGLDGIFRALPPAGTDDCGVPPAGTRSTVATRTFLGQPRDRSVTVVYGVRAPRGTSVRVRYADGATAVLPVGRDGTFVIARRGNLAPQSPRIEIGLPGGRLSTTQLSPSSVWPGRVAERPLDPSEAPR